MEKMTSEMIDETFAIYEKGKKIDGVILKINQDGILVNVGGKRDAYIYNEDIKNKDSLHVGDTICGIVLETKDENGNVKLSNTQYEAIQESKKIAKNVKVGQKLTFKVQQVVNGGVTGKIADFNIFVPMSEIDFANKRNPGLLVGKDVEVYIIQFDAKNKKIVCSVKKVVDEINKVNEDNFWSNIEKNQIVQGTVDKFVEYGAFININNSGFDGLIHNSNVGYLGETAENVFKKDETYSFIILNADPENRRIELGYKQLQDDPRIELYKKYSVGQEVKGKIVKLFTFGAVVELEKKVTGFLHISQVEYGLNDMRDAYKIDDEIDCKIIDIDLTNFKISLSRSFKYEYEVK